MNSQLRRHVASAALIIGFFVVWEVLCLGLGVRDIVLPRPSQIIYTLFARLPAIWPHAMQTLYTTLVGFGLGILFGVLIGALMAVSLELCAVPSLPFAVGTVPAVISLIPRHE